MTCSQLIIHNIKTNFRRDYNKRLQVCTYTQEFTRGKDPATAMASRPFHRRKAKAIATRFRAHQQNRHAKYRMKEASFSKSRRTKVAHKNLPKAKALQPRWPADRPTDRRLKPSQPDSVYINNPALRQFGNPSHITKCASARRALSVLISVGARR